MTGISRDAAEKLQNRGKMMFGYDVISSNAKIISSSKKHRLSEIMMASLPNSCYRVAKFFIDSTELSGGCVTCGLNWIAKKTGVSRSTVYRSILWLEKNKWLSRKSLGDGECYSYLITVPAALRDSPITQNEKICNPCQNDTHIYITNLHTNKKRSSLKKIEPNTVDKSDFGKSRLPSKNASFKLIQLIGERETKKKGSSKWEAEKPRGLPRIKHYLTGDRIYGVRGEELANRNTGGISGGVNAEGASMEFLKKHLDFYVKKNIVADLDDFVSQVKFDVRKYSGKLLKKSYGSKSLSECKGVAWQSCKALIASGRFKRPFGYKDNQQIISAKEFSEHDLRKKKEKRYISSEQANEAREHLRKIMEKIKID